MERLDKLVSARFGLSRKEAREAIRRGRVTADGAVCRTDDQKYDPSVTVALDGVSAVGGGTYYMLYKPAGILTATRDASRQTVLDLIPPALRRRGLFPVGRLDKDTTGLLFITDDGAWAHRLVSPRHHVAKCYRVTLDGAVGADVAEGFAAGVVLADGTVCKPAELTVTDDPATVLVTLREGKYHQIKRMFGVFGLGVTALHRESVGGVSLDPALKPGEVRRLTEAEIAAAEIR